ncbi:MAG: triose-phosphate isomerase [Acidobacteria bacterium]|nr:triose-phosphate isomerase [Acidobacteriota bacterium]
MRKPFISGNWKMHNGIRETKDFFARFLELYADTSDVDVAIAPVFTSIAAAKEACKGRRVHIGAQNMHMEDKGAFTGEIAPVMLKELDVDFVILGHSERRHVFGETNKTIALKLKKAVEEGLLPILCVGETLQERENEKTETVLKEQLDTAFNDLDAKEAARVIVAYEPVWAIGTGKTATPKIAGNAHIFIRNRVKELYNAVAAEDIRILYGGSVKPANARELLSVPDIDGALIGGASLQPDSFAEIIKISLEG